MKIWGTVAGITAAIFPDCDIVLRFINEDIFLRYHRGITTSFVTMFPFCLLLAYIFNKLSAKNKFKEFFLICLAGFFSHIILDLVNSFGTMILAPLSNRRFALDLMFVVDLVFSGILIVSLFLSYFWDKKAGRICRLGLSFCLIYMGFCGVKHHLAKQSAEKYARDNGIEYTELASIPQPFSSLRWANLIDTEDKVYVGFIDFADQAEAGQVSEDLFKVIKAKYFHPSKVEYKAWDKGLSSPWVERAMATEGARFFKWFARFPIVKGVYEGEDSCRVELFDMRFYLFEPRCTLLYAIEFGRQGNLIRYGFVNP